MNIHWQFPGDPRTVDIMIGYRIDNYFHTETCASPSAGHERERRKEGYVIRNRKIEPLSYRLQITEGGRLCCLISPPPPPELVHEMRFAIHMHGRSSMLEASMSIGACLSSLY